VYSRPFHSFINKTDKFSTNFPSPLRKNIVEITVTPNVSSSLQWHYVSYVKLFQFFLTFLQNVNFPWLKTKFPDFTLTIKNFLPDHFLTRDNPGDKIQYSARFYLIFATNCQRNTFLQKGKLQSARHCERFHTSLLKRSSKKGKLRIS